eukprot:gene7842-8653_t
MPKHDSFSPKGLANRQKAVGLQKLRWYCQMCQKQCRDENGFKCHTMSEGHLRAMRLFAENPNSVLDEFSKEFERGYLDTLNRGHGCKRILANRVYQEYIADKHHIHMNATVWTTLTGFLKYLGKEGKAIVDETEKGWFVQFIDRDPKALAREAQAQGRRQADVDDEDRIRRDIEAQVRLAQQQQQQQQGHDSCGLDQQQQQQQADETKREAVAVAIISLNCGGKKRPRGGVVAQGKSLFTEEAESEEEEEDQVQNRLNAHKRPATLSLLMKETSSSSIKLTAAAAPTSASKESSLPSDSSRRSSRWVMEGLVVKIVRGQQSGQKALVQAIFEDDQAELRLLEDGDTVVVPIDSLQTVVPRVGEKAVIVRGAHRGESVEVLRINQDRYCCDLRRSDDRDRSGRKDDHDAVLYGIDYDDFCKIFVD